jgi:hypothetical protein
LVSSFINGANERATVASSLTSTFYAGATLAYPFMPDYYIAVLVASGLSLRAALVSTAALLLSSLFALVYCFNARLTGSARAGALSVWLTLFAGGVGGFVYAAAKPDWWTLDNLTNSAFVHGPDHVLYWHGGRAAFWFSLTAHILFPQRTVQHAYPLALSAMLLVWAAIAKEECAPAGATPPAAGAGAGALDGGDAKALPATITDRLATPWIITWPGNSRLVWVAMPSAGLRMRVRDRSNAALSRAAAAASTRG